MGLAPSLEVGEWVEALAPEELRERAQLIEEVERSRFSSVSPPSAVSTRPDAAPRRGESSSEPIKVVGVESSNVSGVQGIASSPPEDVAALPMFTPLPSIAPPLLSSLSRPPPARFRGRVVALVGFVLFLCGTGVALFIVRPLFERAPHRDSDGIIGAPDVTAVDVDQIDIPPVQRGSNGTAASASASPRPMPSASAEPREIYRGPRWVPPPPRGPDCTPPYTTDDKGHVHFKPACL
jgi:hypothetical protein